ncbi:MAG: hypothetical protein GC181_12455 [Bacteroidetes bacterium]|nr:hypothetical protein [Bacteroidota bacterium]
MSTYKVQNGEIVWNEAHIYGSSRIGLVKENKVLNEDCAVEFDATYLFTEDPNSPAYEDLLEEYLSDAGLTDVSGTVYTDFKNAITQAIMGVPDQSYFETWLTGLQEYLCLFKCYHVQDNILWSNVWGSMQGHITSSTDPGSITLNNNTSIQSYWSGVVSSITSTLVTNYGKCLEDSEKSIRNLGNKRYELANHLGNVLVVITDKKVAVGSVSNPIDYFMAEITSISDYYPCLPAGKAFGMGISETGYAAPEGGYRFGFNGMEKDDEVNGYGNSLDFGARIYDSRLGRWLSRDPLQKKYASLSPYNFVSNKPINFIDPNGMEIVSSLNVVNTEKVGTTKQIVTVSGSITIKVKIVNLSTTKDLDVGAIAKGIESHAISGFAQNAGYSVQAYDLDGTANNTEVFIKTNNIKVNVEVEVITSLEDIKDDDHVIMMVDEITDPGKDVDGKANSVGGNVALVETKSDLERMIKVGTHEIGHLLGMSDAYTENDPAEGKLMGRNSGYSTSYLERGDIIRQAYFRQGYSNYLKSQGKTVEPVKTKKVAKEFKNDHTP